LHKKILLYLAYCNNSSHNYKGEELSDLLSKIYGFPNRIENAYFTLHRAIRRLEKAGLVKKIHVNSDHGHKELYISLTHDGTYKAEDIKKDIKSFFDEFSEFIENSERRRWLSPRSKRNIEPIE